MSERHEEALALLHDICDLFGIGADARSRDVILTNVQNAKRRSECLNRVEWEFFTTTETDEDGEEYEDCPLNWGANSQEYAEQFRGALATLKQETEARVLEMAAKHIDVPYTRAGHEFATAVRNLSTKNLPTSPKSVADTDLSVSGEVIDGAIIATSVEVDFGKGTWTFEPKGEWSVMAGDYYLIPVKK